MTNLQIIVMQGHIKISSRRLHVHAQKHIQAHMTTDVNQYLHSITVLNVSVSHVSRKITSTVLQQIYCQAITKKH